jgi:hypothetical protein
MTMRYLLECDSCDRLSKSFRSLRALKAHTRRWSHTVGITDDTTSIDSHRCDECARWEAALQPERLLRR